MRLKWIPAFGLVARRLAAGIHFSRIRMVSPQSPLHLSIWGVRPTFASSFAVPCALLDRRSLHPVAHYSPKMASNMPLPVPPRTPTPPPEEDAPQPVGLGLDGELSPGRLGYLGDTLSPMSATFPSKQFATLGPSDSVSQRATPTTQFTPASATFPYTPTSTASGMNDVEGPEKARNPFNFQPVSYAPAGPQMNNKSVSALQH
jgi:hypothetical protein